MVVTAGQQDTRLRLRDPVLGHDLAAMAAPVTKWSVTVREPGLVPRAFQQAFHLMRSGRPGPVLIDMPFDV